MLPYCCIKTRVISEAHTSAQVLNARVSVSGKRWIVGRDLWLGGAGGPVATSTYAGAVQLYRARYSGMLVVRRGLSAELRS